MNTFKYIRHLRTQSVCVYLNVEINVRTRSFAMFFSPPLLPPAAPSLPPPPARISFLLPCIGKIAST